MEGSMVVELEYLLLKSKICESVLQPHVTESVTTEYAIVKVMKTNPLRPGPPGDYERN